MELKDNELRIGNLFDHMDDGILSIEEIKKDSDGFKGYYAVFRNGSIKCHVSYLQPIPLTEEWLLEFGFEKEHVTVNDIIINIYRLGDYEISIYLQGNETQKGYYLPHSLQSRAYIKYVHQLQNLYFSLTNNEIKLIK